MIPLVEFRAENRAIKDLCTILGMTIDQHGLRRNSIVCELMDRFVVSVNGHLAHEDRSIYGELLKQHTKEANAIADKFLGNTQELKRIFNTYTHDWCRKQHSKSQHDEYAEESREMFRLVCKRLDFEEEKIFPHFE